MTAAPYVLSVATEFGDWLEERMAEIGMSQADLSDRSGVSESQLSRYRNSKTVPDPTTLRKLAPHLDASFDSMMILAGHLVGDEKSAAKTYIIRTEDPKVHRLIRIAKDTGEGVQPGDLTLVENLLKDLLKNLGQRKR